MINNNGTFGVLTSLAMLASFWSFSAAAVEGAKHKAPAKAESTAQAQDVKKTSQKDSWQKSLDDMKASVAQLSDDVAAGAAQTSEVARKNIKADIERSTLRLKELGDDLTQAVRQADAETRTAAQATIKDLNESLARLSAKLETKPSGVSDATSGKDKSAGEKSAKDDDEYPDNVEFPELED